MHFVYYSKCRLTIMQNLGTSLVVPMIEFLQHTHTKLRLRILWFCPHLIRWSSMCEKSFDLLNFLQLNSCSIGVQCSRTLASNSRNLFWKHHKKQFPTFPQCCRQCLLSMIKCIRCSGCDSIATPQATCSHWTYYALNCF